ncbi:MAG TPA: hypothetical protein VF595_00930 [Tepidisphaeraceae bacterium]|jgi:hypothetical protein
MGRRLRIGAGIFVSVLAVAGVAAWVVGVPSFPATGKPTVTPRPEHEILLNDVIAIPAHPATQPKPPGMTAPPPPADVLAVLRLDDPKYPTTAPLDLPTDLIDAARIVLTRPAYVDPLGNLWLTHPKGRPVVEILANGVVDRTAVVREKVHFVSWPTDGGPGSAIVDMAGEEDGVPPGGPVVLRPTPRRERELHTLPARYQSVTVPGRGRDGTHFSGERFDVDGADFARAVFIPGGVVVPAGKAVLLFSTDLASAKRIELPGAPGPTSEAVLAPAGDGVWAWSPWDRGTGSRGAIFVDAAGSKEPDPAAGWPDKPIELVPLADGSVLVVAVEGDVQAVLAGRASPVLKLIPAAEKPPTSELLRTIGAMARQLADPDPLKRDAAQRQLEAQGPAAYPVLEALREQVPPEAQVRIETLLGQRFAPTLAGLRPLEGKCYTIARFPGGGCALRLDGGGTVQDGDAGATRTVIPATLLIRPGRSIELIDPTAVSDFRPGRQSIQWVGNELIVADPTAGPRRWVGLTLQPVVSKAFVDFDTVVSIDARRRWLLTSARQPGKTLLLDPTLPDPTPRLPVWTVAAHGGVGRTDIGWPAVKRDDRLFVLERGGWRVDKPHALRPPTTMPFIDGPGGRQFEVRHNSIQSTNAAGRTVSTTLPADTPEGVHLAAVGERLFVYTSDGRVRRYAIGDNGSVLTLEATFTQGVPTDATAVWIDPAGRLVMTTANALSIAFPEGRVPRTLADLMLRVER